MRSLSVVRRLFTFVAATLTASLFFAARLANAEDAPWRFLPSLELPRTNFDRASYPLNAPYALDENEFDDEDSVVYYVDEQDEFPAPARPVSGFLAACLGDDELVYRGQSANSIIPPTESPTSTSTIGTAAVSDATSNVVAPPVVGTDEPFDPKPITPSNGEPTTFQKIFKYRQELSAYYMFIPNGKKKGLGTHELNARLLFAIPCQTMQSVNNMNNGYFLLTPHFTYDHLFLSKDLQRKRENFFDAGLTTTFLANYNDLEAHVDFSIGVGATFKKIKGKAIYFKGRAEVGMPIDNDKQVKLFGGVAYLDAIRYKLIPIVGVEYNPNPQNRLRIAFPNPRWDHYLTKVNDTDWWCFVHGDLTSQRWFVNEPTITVGGKHAFVVDYSDYKIGAGVSFDCPTRLRGSFEVGGAFGRQMKTKDGKLYDPRNAVYLKVGLLY